MLELKNVINVTTNVLLVKVLLKIAKFVPTKQETSIILVNVNLDSLITVLPSVNLVLTSVPNVLDKLINVLFVLILIELLIKIVDVLTDSLIME